MSGSAWVLVVVGALAFAAIGSFTCVVIDRLPVQLAEANQFGDTWDTRPWRQVFEGRSRCSSCGEPVRATDNVPLLSWLLLRGRCRSCGERIPGFHPVVELTTALLFLLAVWALGADWRLMVLLWLIPVGVAVSVIDLRTFIVPTRIVWPAFAVTVVLSVAAAAIEQEWSWLLSALVGLLVFAGPLFTIWFIRPQGMGFGDVRLAVLLGWGIGFLAGTRPIGAVVLSLFAMALAALVGIVVGVVALGARGRKARVPFGPAMVTAALFCMAFADQILDPFGI